MRSKGDDMREPLLPPEALGPEQAEAIRNFLLGLADDPDLLVEYVRNRVAVLRESGLSDEAQTLLLEDNYTRVHQVMKQSSTPARWLVIWII
jgi:hypothetical protein